MNEGKKNPLIKKNINKKNTGLPNKNMNKGFNTNRTRGVNPNPISGNNESLNEGKKIENGDEKSSINDVFDESITDGDNEGKETRNILSNLFGLRKKKILFKIIIGAIAFLFPLIFIIVLAISMFSSLGIINLDGGIENPNSYVYSSNYVSVSDNSDYWWPIGGSEITTVGGIQFAVGEPTSVNITATFAGDDSTHQGSHGAIDIGVEINVGNVIATKDGTVIYPGEDDGISYPNGWYNSSTHTCSRDGGGFGNYVKIDHGDGIISIYGHMYADTITVRTGDVVKQGQVIGKSGTSGCSSGGHLHFELRQNGVPIDPLNYVDPNKPRPTKSNISINDSNKVTEELE